MDRQTFKWLKNDHEAALGWMGKSEDWFDASSVSDLLQCSSRQARTLVRSAIRAGVVSYVTLVLPTGSRLLVGQFYAGRK